MVALEVIFLAKLVTFAHFGLFSLMDLHNIFKKFQNRKYLSKKAFQWFDMINWYMKRQELKP